MRLNAGLPKLPRVEGINTTSFIVNRSPLSAIDFKFPQVVLLDKLVDYSSLKIFDCVAYVHL